jgi:hypothetical protein
MTAKMILMMSEHCACQYGSSAHVSPPTSGQSEAQVTPPFLISFPSTESSHPFVGSNMLITHGERHLD